MSVEWTKGTEDLLQKILEAGLYMFVRERGWDKDEMHAFVHGYSGDCKVLPTSGYQIPLWGTEVYTCSSGLSDVLIKILTGIQIWFPNWFWWLGLCFISSLLLSDIHKSFFPLHFFSMCVKCDTFQYSWGFLEIQIFHFLHICYETKYWLMWPTNLTS